MALGDYTPTAWVNGTTPAISATTLGNIETKVDEIDAAFLGQPPAPKQNRTSAATIGYVTLVDIAGSGASITTPATTGSWMWMVMGYGQTTSIGTIGIAAGSASAIGTTSQVNTRIFWWRIA